MNIQAVLNSLAEKRPIYHNEADFQHALAWELHEMYGCKIRLERLMNMDSKRRMYLDIFVEHNGKKIAIELKYKMRAVQHTFEGENFSLLNQGAQDIGRYDVLKDLQRLEQLVKNNLVDEGYLIFLTNDHTYYRDPGVEKMTADRNYRFHEGREITGKLTWSENTGEGTMKGREESIVITGTYKSKWDDYSFLDHSLGGCIKALRFHITPSIVGGSIQIDDSTLRSANNFQSAIALPVGTDGGKPEITTIVKSISNIPVSQVDLRDKLVACLVTCGFKVDTNRDLGFAKIDIWAEKDGEAAAIEVRYKTALLKTIYNNKRIDFKNQAAQDIARYNFLKDMEKLETVAAKRPGTKGYAILITNDHSYWNKSKRDSSVDEEFRIHQGRVIHGNLSWKNASGGTTENREESITIKGDYCLEWEPFLILGNGKNESFQVLVIEVGIKEA